MAVTNTGGERAPSEPHAAAAWQCALQRCSPSSQLGRAWRDGLARNRAAPASVLRRLLDVGPGERLPSGLVFRELPEEVVEDWIAHPDWNVRKGLAERSMLDARHRARLFRDPDPAHRWVFLTCAVDDRSELTDETFARLAADPSPRVRAELALHRDLPVRHLTALASDPAPEVRRAAAPRAWPHLDSSAQAALRTDPDPGVRTAAVLRHHHCVPMPVDCFAGLPDDRHRERAAADCMLTRGLAESLVYGVGPTLRRAAAQNVRLHADLVARLGKDPDPAVRLLVSVRPDLTEAQRSRIAVEFDPSARCNPLPWVLALAADEAAVRRCAASAHPMLRRSVAWMEHLPPDVVALLAHDDDWVVRLFLAERCSEAPPEVLLEMARKWNGYSLVRIVNHPNFPRRHTLRYADDPDPRTRRLALMDPSSSAELVELFSKDSRPDVRRQALRDPRLSSDAVVRLLDDPDHGIRDTAAADPRLPVHVVTALLHRTATACQAARNPAIPAVVMHRLLDQSRPVDGHGVRPSPPRTEEGAALPPTADASGAA